MNACPKPEPRKRTKGRAKRAEKKVVVDVRSKCVERDGYCRLAGLGFGQCAGESQWAHLGERKRFKTRGLPPEERHATTHSIMLCEAHHYFYDKGVSDSRICIELTQPQGADLPRSLRFTSGELSYQEV